MLDSIIQVIITVFALIFMVYGGDIIVGEKRRARRPNVPGIKNGLWIKVYWVMPISGDKCGVLHHCERY